MTFADPAQPNAFNTCLRLGGWTIDRVSLSPSRESSTMVVKVHSGLKAPAAWATDSLAKPLPDVDYTLKQGLYFTGSLTMMDGMRNGDTDAPRVGAVTLMPPKINYQTLRAPYDMIPELKIAEADFAALAAQPAVPALDARSPAPSRPRDAKPTTIR